MNGSKAKASDLSEAGLKGMYLGRIGGIRISLDYSWFFIFFLVLWSLSMGYFPEAHAGARALHYWVAGLAATILFFVSILLHELGHSFVALRHGIKMTGIKLFLFGGVAETMEEANNPKVDLQIAAAGPLVSFNLSLIFFLLGQALAGSVHPLLSGILSYLAFINLALGIFNLLPGYPLDGGRILRALWWWRTNSFIDATRVASRWGRGFAFALMLLGALEIFFGSLVGGMWLILIGAFLRSMAFAGYEQALLNQLMSDVTVSDLMVRDYVSVPSTLSVKALLNDFFLRYTFRGFPVIEEGQLRGIVHLKRLRDIPPDTQESVQAKDIMYPISEENTVGPNESLKTAARKMARFSPLLVVDGQALKGLLTKHALVRFLEIKQVLKGVNDAAPSEAFSRSG